MKKLNVSKKRLVFGAKIVIQSFIKELTAWRRKYRNKRSLCYYSISAPKKLRKFILKTVLRSAALINIEYRKPFNGCKAKKRRRKKRLGFRSYK